MKLLIKLRKAGPGFDRTGRVLCQRVEVENHLKCFGHIYIKTMLK